MISAVILTKSNKDNGYCVIAYDLVSERFIRFVADRNGAALSKMCMTGITLLDIVNVNIVGQVPLSPQTENIFIDSSSIMKTGHSDKPIEFFYNKALQQNSRPFFMDNNQDRLKSVSQYTHSFELIKVTGFHVYQNDFKKNKCSFTYNSLFHSNISITDPEYLGTSVQLSEAYLLVSIPFKDYEGDFYKFVAAVYPVESRPIRSLKININRTGKTSPAPICEFHHIPMTETSMPYNGKTVPLYLCKDCGIYYTDYDISSTSYNNKLVKKSKNLLEQKMNLPIEIV